MSRFELPFNVQVVFALDFELVHDCLETGWVCWIKPNAQSKHDVAERHDAGNLKVLRSRSKSKDQAGCRISLGKAEVKWVGEVVLELA